MLAIFDNLRELSFLSTVIRMLLAFLCGGVIGLERAYKHRPAGFRTHILICLGASMTTLTSQFLYLELHYFTDMARLGAQVIAGIGFIGAGAIIVTKNQRVKGLTTAAGLWAAAIIGLTFGAGFYEAGLIATLLILLAEILLTRVEYRVLKRVREINVLIEYTSKNSLDQMLLLFRQLGIKITNMEITRSSGSRQYNASVIFALRLNGKVGAPDLLDQIRELEGVMLAEEFS